MASKAGKNALIDGSMTREIFGIGRKDIRNLSKPPYREWTSEELARLSTYVDFVPPSVEKQIERAVVNSGSTGWRMQGSKYEIDLTKTSSQLLAEILTLCTDYFEEKIQVARNDPKIAVVFKNLLLRIVDLKLQRLYEKLGEPARDDGKKYQVFIDTDYEVSSGSDLSSGRGYSTSSSTSSGSTTSGESASSASSSRSTRSKSSLDDMNTMFGTFYALTM
jgi:hypothetical protein